MFVHCSSSANFLFSIRPGVYDAMLLLLRIRSITARIVFRVFVTTPFLPCNGLPGCFVSWRV